MTDFEKTPYYWKRLQFMNESPVSIVDKSICAWNELGSLGIGSNSFKNNLNRVIVGGGWVLLHCLS